MTIPMLLNWTPTSWSHSGVKTSGEPPAAWLCWVTGGKSSELCISSPPPHTLLVTQSQSAKEWQFSQQWRRGKDAMFGQAQLAFFLISGLWEFSWGTGIMLQRRTPLCVCLGCIYNGKERKWESMGKKVHTSSSFCIWRQWCGWFINKLQKILLWRRPLPEEDPLIAESYKTMLLFGMGCKMHVIQYKIVELRDVKYIQRLKLLIRPTCSFWKDCNIGICIFLTSCGIDI